MAPGLHFLLPSELHTWHYPTRATHLTRHKSASPVTESFARGTHVYLDPWPDLYESGQVSKPGCWLLERKISKTEIISKRNWSKTTCSHSYEGRHNKQKNSSLTYRIQMTRCLADSSLLPVHLWPGNSPHHHHHRYDTQANMWAGATNKNLDLCEPCLRNLLLWHYNYRQSPSKHPEKLNHLITVSIVATELALREARQ